MTAAQLRRRLRTLEVSQLEAARRLGVDGRTVRRWVAGDSPIPNPVALLLDCWLRDRPSSRPRRRGKP